MTLSASSLQPQPRPQLGSRPGNAPSSGHPGLWMPVQQLLAACMLAVLSPLLLAVVILIRLESRGPAVFHQPRVGRDGQHFKLYKFRSMYITGDRRPRSNSAAISIREGLCAKYRNDPRVTAVGHNLRVWSIDELPQLINVVRGEMALVGPRPALVEEVAAYPEPALARLSVLPGLSGLWQVSGRADTSFEQQIELDLRYVNKASPSFDLLILLRTVSAVLGRRGAY